MEFTNICKANILGTLVFMTLLFLGSKDLYIYNFSRKMVLSFALINIILETAKRSFMRTTLHSTRSKGYSQKRILLVGYSRAAEGFVNRMQQDSEWGYQVRGILDDNRERGSEYRGVRVIRMIPNLDIILGQNTLDETTITPSIDEYMKLKGIISSCGESRVHTKFIPDCNNIIPTRPYIKDLQGPLVINIRHVPSNDVLSAVIKRLMDIFDSLAGIIVFSPVMLLTAVIIKCTSPGLIICKQERVGLHNRVFKVYKFHSMEAQHPVAERSEQMKPHDPRVAPIGKFIRKTSIDETPQFFNVLFGNMSLVGLRPERPFFVERFKEEIPGYMIKHQVHPGMTGQTQVSRLRRDTSIAKRVEHDLYYIEDWTLGSDFKVLSLAVFKGLINKNVYQNEVRRMSFDYDDELEYIEADKGAWEKAFEEKKSRTRVSKWVVDEDAERKARVNTRSMARQQRTVRNKRGRRIIAAIAAKVLILVFIFEYAYIHKIHSRPQRLEFKENNIKDTGPSMDDIKKMKGCWMTAILGMDSRDTNVGKGINAGVNMIVCISQSMGDIKLVSVHRGFHLNIDDKGSCNKINQAYAIGEPGQAVKALNKNLSLNITDYITFNWRGVANAINALGGVDVGVTKSEFEYANSSTMETVKTAGIDPHQLKSSGMNRLDDVQAVAYGRLRLMGAGFARTERQRKIIQLALRKAKVADYSTLNSILVVVLPQMTTSLSFGDLTNAASNITKYRLGEIGGSPTAKGDVNMGKKGLCVVPQTLESDMVRLHKSLFDDEAYTTINMVKKISTKISSDTSTYSQDKSQTGSQIPRDKNELRTSATRETTTEEETSWEVETDEYGNPVISGSPETDEGGNVTLNFMTGNGESSPDESGSEFGDSEDSLADVSQSTGFTMPGQTRPVRPADLSTNPTSATKPREITTPKTTSGGPGHNSEPTALVPNTSSGPIAMKSETTASASPGGSPGGSSGGNTGGSPGETPRIASPVSSGDMPGKVIGNDGPG